MEEVHIKVGYNLSTVEHPQPVRIGECTKHGGFNRFSLTDRHQFLYILRRHSNYHPFLCFREPNLPRLKGCVFERYVFQMHICPCILTHLTNSRGESTGTTICDIAIELAVPGTHQGIDNLLLHNRIPDLHDAAEAFGGVVQLQRGERRPMNPIAPSASTDGNDQVAGFHRFIASILGNQTNVATIDKRIPRIAWIEQDCTIRRRNPHAIAVVPHARDNTFENPFWVERAFGQLVIVEIG